MTLKPKTAAEQLDILIADIESFLGIAPGEDPFASKKSKQSSSKEKGKPKLNDAGKAKKKKGNEKQSKKKTAESKHDGDQPDITKLDIRVGVITKVWHHESADKLFCEEIDVGEPEPRQIASGLRPHYTLDQMQGRKILVLCNLKAANLKGFKSSGMVLCAAAENDATVEFVDPPANANVGDKIFWEGIDPSFEPITAAQMGKKKVFAAVVPDFKTNDGRVATWKGHKMMTSSGPCIAPTVANGCIR
mmetsp:Transcript_40014/g.52678  ORF Transcript_40014/g.52678 Transcript_40014/m.52678 type:complete len:247 (-) Transcript_40014:378-1118(-)